MMRASTSRRNLCLFLSLMVFWSHAVFAYQSDLLATVPPAHGTVRQIAGPSHPNSRLVIHIQDVHRNKEAQANIGALLKNLIQKWPVSVVGLEGAFEPFDLKKYQSFRYQDSVQAVADYLLDTQRISGALHTGLTAGPVEAAFVGVDDPHHYWANVEAYKQSAPQQEARRAAHQKDQQHHQRHKAQRFNPNLKRFDNRVQAFQHGHIPMGVYLRHLSEERGRLPVQLSLFLEAVQREKRLDFSQVKREKARFLKKLTQTLTAVEKAEFLELSRAHNTGKLGRALFYERVQQWARLKGLSLASVPAFQDYIQYVLLSDRIQAESLFQEIRQTEQNLYARLIKTEEERRLVQRSRRLYLIGKLIDFSLTPQEWKEYGEVGWGMDGLPHFEAFYRHAEARNHKMAGRLLRAMDKKDARVAVLITGGFHSDGINTLLSQAGLRTVTLTPKITQVESHGASSYLSAFTQEKTPLDQLFTGKKLFVSEFQGLPNSILSGSMIGHRILKTGQLQDASRLGNDLFDKDDPRPHRIEVKSPRHVVLRFAQGALHLVTRVSGQVQDMRFVESVFKPAAVSLLVSLVIKQTLFWMTGSDLSWARTVQIFTLLWAMWLLMLNWPRWEGFLISWGRPRLAFESLAADNHQLPMSKSTPEHPLPKLTYKSQASLLTEHMPSGQVTTLLELFLERHEGLTILDYLVFLNLGKLNRIADAIIEAQNKVFVRFKIKTDWKAVVAQLPELTESSPLAHFIVQVPDQQMRAKLAHSIFKGKIDLTRKIGHVPHLYQTLQLGIPTKLWERARPVLVELLIETSLLFRLDLDTEFRLLQNQLLYLPDNKKVSESFLDLNPKLTILEYLILREVLPLPGPEEQVRPLYWAHNNILEILDVPFGRDALLARLPKVVNTTPMYEVLFRLESEEMRRELAVELIRLSLQKKAELLGYTVQKFLEQRKRIERTSPSFQQHKMPLKRVLDSAKAESSSLGPPGSTAVAVLRWLTGVRNLKILSFLYAPQESKWLVRWLVPLAMTGFLMGWWPGWGVAVVLAFVFGAIHLPSLARPNRDRGELQEDPRWEKNAGPALLKAGGALVWMWGVTAVLWGLVQILGLSDLSLPAKVYVLVASLLTAFTISPTFETLHRRLNQRRLFTKPGIDLPDIEISSPLWGDTTSGVILALFSATFFVFVPILGDPLSLIVSLVLVLLLLTYRSKVLQQIVPRSAPQPYEPNPELTETRLDETRLHQEADLLGRSSFHQNATADQPLDMVPAPDEAPTVLQNDPVQPHLSEFHEQMESPPEAISVVDAASYFRRAGIGLQSTIHDASVLGRLAEEIESRQIYKRLEGVGHFIPVWPGRTDLYSMKKHIDRLTRVAQEVGHLCQLDPQAIAFFILWSEIGTPPYGTFGQKGLETAIGGVFKQTEFEYNQIRFTRDFLVALANNLDIRGALERHHLISDLVHLMAGQESQLQTKEAQLVHAVRTVGNPIESTLMAGRLGWLQNHTELQGAFQHLTQLTQPHGTGRLTEAQFEILYDNVTFGLLFKNLDQQTLQLDPSVQAGFTDYEQNFVKAQIRPMRWDVVQAPMLSVILSAVAEGLPRMRGEMANELTRLLQKDITPSKILFVFLSLTDRNIFDLYGLHLDPYQRLNALLTPTLLWVSPASSQQKDKEGKASSTQPASPWTDGERASVIEHLANLYTPKQDHTNTYFNPAQLVLILIGAALLGVSSWGGLILHLVVHELGHLLFYVVIYPVVVGISVRAGRQPPSFSIQRGPGLELRFGSLHSRPLEIGLAAAGVLAHGVLLGLGLWWVDATAGWVMLGIALLPIGKNSDMRQIIEKITAPPSPPESSLDLGLRYANNKLVGQWPQTHAGLLIPLHDPSSRLDHHTHRPVLTSP